MKLTKGETLLLLVNVAYILFFIVYFILVKNYEFILYNSTIISVIILFIFLHRKFHFSLFTLWALSVGAFLHLFAGGFYISNTRLYDLILIPLYKGVGEFDLLRTDQVMHFIGFFIWAFVFYDVLKSRIKSKGNLLPIFISCLCSLAIGSLAEVVEFSTVVFFAATGVGDYYNNALDLVFNTIGALTAGILIYLKEKYFQN